MTPGYFCAWCFTDIDEAADWPLSLVRDEPGLHFHAGCHEAYRLERAAAHVRLVPDDQDHDYVHESVQEAYDNDQRERFGA